MGEPVTTAETFPQLLLESQLCFPLYAGARRVVNAYTPFLRPLGLTYTQYIVMLALWEQRELSVKELGSLLRLDSGTLTPVLKKLEHRGLLTRCRSQEDERCVILTLTEQGTALREAALSVPAGMGACVRLSGEEAAELYRLLYKLLEGLA